MAIISMIYGVSGTGKSTSLRNFKKGEISMVNVSRKPLPFKADFAVASSDDYEVIKKAILNTKSKSIVIDDATYLIVNEYMRNAEVKGFDKYSKMALNFWGLLNFCINEVPQDKIVYFIGHSEIADDGREHFKTVGKMLDNLVCIDGLFSIVFKTVLKDGKYYFQTHNSGYDTVKTPIGMFEADLIDNDLKVVDQRIREFWELDKAPVTTKTNKDGKEEIVY